MARETETTRCRACGAEIVFLRTGKKNPRGEWIRMPVDAGKVERDDVQFDGTRHTSHFATCPDADKFRRRDRA